MKPAKLKQAFGGLLVFFLMSRGNISAQDYPIQIFMDHFPPYNYMENGEPKGFATDIVKRIMKTSNVNFKIKSFPHSRLHLMFEGKKGIVAYVLFRTPEREDLYKWIGPIATDHVHIYKKKGSQLIINNIDDAKNNGPISTFAKGVILSRLVEMGFTNLEKVTNVDSTILMLLHDRVSLMAGLPDLSIKYWLEQNKYSSDALSKTAIRIASFDMYILCSKDIPDRIVKKWQTALDALKSSGEFDRLYNKYK